MAAHIDLNCDLGEGVGDDAALFRVVSSANIACGFHAGDAGTMLESCRLAVRHGVVIGAHPSYPDREGFGRRTMERTADDLFADTVEQVAALAEAATAAGGRVRYVKPHGALYNRIAVDEAQAGAVVSAVASIGGGLVLLGPPDSAVERASRAAAVPFRREAFADRAYLADGTLAPRGLAGAVITDAGLVGERAVALAATGTVTVIDGSVIAVPADSICLHGDTPGAPAIAAAVRDAITRAGIEIRAFA